MNLRGCLLLALLFSFVISAHGETHLIYINGIQVTSPRRARDDAEEMIRKLNSSANRSGTAKRTFTAEYVWNPIGFRGNTDGCDSCEDLKELFLLKTAEEHYGADFRKLLAAHNSSSVLDREAATRVKAYFDDLTPSGNYLVDSPTGSVTDDDMKATRDAIVKIVDHLRLPGKKVFIAHSQANLLVNLAWAVHVSEVGTAAQERARFINVANTSLFSISRLDISHTADKALLNLQVLPSLGRDWTRTTPSCAGAACSFALAPRTFSGASVTLADPSGHFFRKTYLSDNPLPSIVDPQGVTFTAEKTGFFDRFEDIVYAAAASLDATTPPPPGNVTIAFSGLNGAHGSPLTNYSEGGFTVSVQEAPWTINRLQGGPQPSISSSPPVMPTVWPAVRVTAGGQRFTFRSVTLGTFYLGTIPQQSFFGFKGYLDGVAQFSYSTVTAFDGLGTEVNAFSSTAIDALVIEMLPFGSDTTIIDNISVAGTGPKTGEGMLDTGITSEQCYRAGSNIFVSCTSADAIELNASQDGMIGRDAAYPNANDGKLGFSYVKLDSNGQELPMDAVFWDCVRDRVTGQVWEHKNFFDPTHLRHDNRRYTNFGDGRVGDASKYVADVNSTGLCGFNDWRLPTARELQGIVDYGRPLVGTFGVDYFLYASAPAGGGTSWWTGDVSALAGRSFMVYFHGSIAAGLRSEIHPVRLVRGLPKLSQFVISADGNEVTDASTGLIWQRCLDGMTWDATQNRCAGPGLPVYEHQWALERARDSGGWRLPSIKELTTLATAWGANSVVDETVFPGSTDFPNVHVGIWSSTPYLGNTSQAWVFQPTIGTTFPWSRANFGGVGAPGYPIRLVRDGTP